MIVKKFSNQDINTRVEWINNPAINNSMYFELPATIEKTLIWYESNLNNNKRKDFSFFNEGDLVAMGGLTSIDKLSNHAELYVMVNPENHGQGWGKKSTQWLLFYGFNYLKLNKIYLFTDGENVSGYSLYEAIGMINEGTMRQHKFKDESLRDRRIYSILATEWQLLDYVEAFRYAT